jgi:hypothetical protein
MLRTQHPAGYVRSAVLRAVLVAIAGLIAAGACAPSGTQTQATATPQQSTTGVTATQTMQATPTSAPAATATTAPSGGSQAGAGQAFADVPLPPGAVEGPGAAQYNQMLSAMLAGGGVNQSDFTSITGKLYNVNSAPRQVLDFYNTNMGGWTNQSQMIQAPGGQQAVVGFWTRDNGNRILWILVTEGSVTGSSAGSQMLVWEARK